MFEHEHGEVVGIGVGDVDVLSVHVDRRRETAGVETRTRAGGIVCVPSPGAMESNPRPGMASAAPLAWCGTHAAASRSAIAWTIRKSNVRDSWPRREPADPPARSAGGCAARPRAAVGTTRSPVPRTSRSIQAGVTRWRFPLPRAWRGRAGTAWRTRPSRLIGKLPVGVGICLTRWAICREVSHCGNADDSTANTSNSCLPHLSEKRRLPFDPSAISPHVSLAFRLSMHGYHAHHIP